MTGIMKLREAILLSIIIKLIFPGTVSQFHPLYQSHLGGSLVRIQMLKRPAPDNSSIVLKHMIAFPNFPGPFPAVVILHDKFGRDSWADSRAVYFGRQGFVGYALDYLGANTDSDNASRKEYEQLYRRGAIIERVKQGLSQLKTMRFLRKDKLIVVGYGYGALTALGIEDPEISGIIAVHPPLLPSMQLGVSNSTKLMLFYRNNNSKLKAMTRTLSEKGIDWQVNLIGPRYDTGDGHPSSDHRTWAFSLMFITETFKETS